MVNQQQIQAVLTNEKRLSTLNALQLLDTPVEEAFDRLTRLASKITDSPVSLVSLLDVDRQFFKSFVGLSGYSCRLYPQRDDRVTPKCAYIPSKLQQFLGPIQASYLVYRGSANFILVFLDRISYPVLPFLRGLVLSLSLALLKGDVCCLSQGLNFIGFDS